MNISNNINKDQLNDINRHLRNIQLLNNLINIISNPTRVTAILFTLIDPILVPHHCDPLHSGVLDIPLTVSDHRATFACFPFTCICTYGYKRKVWFYKIANFENLNEMISSQDWNFINSLSVDEACDIFTSKLSDFCHASIPNEVTIRPK